MAKDKMERRKALFVTARMGFRARYALRVSKKIIIILRGGKKKKLTYNL